MDYDYTLEWSDLQESMKKKQQPTMTADEEERKAREREIMLDRAAVALEGNRKVFGSGKEPMVMKSSSGSCWKKAEKREGDEWVYFRG